MISTISSRTLSLTRCKALAACIGNLFVWRLGSNAMTVDVIPRSANQRYVTCRCCAWRSAVEQSADATASRVEYGKVG
jgi:hypothetical protein